MIDVLINSLDEHNEANILATKELNPSKVYYIRSKDDFDKMKVVTEYYKNNLSTIEIKEFIVDEGDNRQLEEIINEVKLRNYELDCNTAGLRKQYCGEKYPSGDLYDLAIKNNIQMVYGSDSHEAKDVGFNFK